MNTTLIENKFNETMKVIAASKLTAVEVKKDRELYNKLAVISYEFFEKVVLLSNRNRSYMNSTGIEFAEFVDDVVMHFLNNLDKVIACNDDYRIGFVVMMANNKVIDKVRSWYRMYPVKSKESNGKEESTYDVVNFLDEIEWSKIATDNNVEETVALHLEALEVLGFCSKCTKFEIISFLGTKVLGIKNSVISNEINKCGFESASNKVLNMAAEVFEISLNTYFDKFSSEDCVDFNDIEDLSDKISKKSCYCESKLAKMLGVKHNHKTRNKDKK